MSVESLISYIIKECFFPFPEAEPGTNLDMFGFKMPDNFDLPDDFFSEIRSSEKSRPEPNETVNDDPMVRYSYYTVG